MIRPSSEKKNKFLCEFPLVLKGGGGGGVYQRKEQLEEWLVHGDFLMISVHKSAPNLGTVSCCYQTASVKGNKLFISNHMKNCKQTNLPSLFQFGNRMVVQTRNNGHHIVIVVQFSAVLNSNT
jgi:hypothetical protein